MQFLSAMASGIVGVSSSDDDDLWGYGGAEEPSEDQQTPGDGQDDDDDGLECYLPEHKRAKLALQRKARRAGTIHDLDEARLCCCVPATTQKTLSLLSL